VDTAEDLRQEVFVRVYRYARTYNPDFAFSTWLFRIATNALNTWRSGQNRRDTYEVPSAGEDEALEPIDFSPNPREAAVLGETVDRVREVIERLPVVERELLLLRLDLDFSYREIGEVQDVPETTVKSRFYNLMVRLRRELKEFEYVERTVPK
jgi:RNA polymerase sigma-70 factor (ECF subfamily)